MTATDTTTPLIGRVPIAQIDVPDDHQRNTGDMEGLANSIASEGLLNPILLRQKDSGRYELVAGGRRLTAVKGLGQDTILAHVRDADEATKVVLRTTENVQRHALHPIEEAREYHVLHVQHELTQQEIARRVGRSAVHVGQRLALLRLPPDQQARIGAAEDALSLGDALELARLSNHPDRLQAAATAVRGGLPAATAVENQLARLAADSDREAAKERVRQAGGVVFEGVIGRDGWAVSDTPEPGHLYWPAGRSSHESFQIGVGELEGRYWVCVNPLMHLQDPDPQVAESAAALVELTKGDTAEEPAQPITADEAEKRAKQAESKHFREMRKRDELREAHLTKRVRGRVVAGDVTDLIFGAFINSLSVQQRDTVLARCNVARVERTDGFGEEWDLKGYLSGRGSLLKLAYAAALQVDEDQVDAAVKAKTRLLHGPLADRVLLYFQHLEGTGYQLSPGEQELADMESEPAPSEEGGDPAEE